MLTKTNDSVSINTSSCGNYDLTLKLFDTIPIKNISVSVTPNKYVIPSGDTIGIKLYTDGLLVVALSDFKTNENIFISPAKKAGIKKGDTITHINSIPISSVEEFSRILSSSIDNVVLDIKRNEEKLSFNIKPERSIDDGTMKLGMWVRDSTAGIGTLTYYSPDDNSFGALGHGICDADTNQLMSVRKGSILSSNILSVIKGETGKLGELVGSFGNVTLGNISSNCETGIYGVLKNPSSILLSQPLPVATRFQIKEGPAYILADIDTAGLERYEISVEKVSSAINTGNKGMIIKITDEKLLSKTGGIVQGMSGSPIIQNDMLIGAITHVFVNDSTRGYGIFIENMLSDAEKF